MPPAAELYTCIKDVCWLQLFTQFFFLHLFFASKIYNKTFNTKIAMGYLLHPISLKLNKFETDTPTEEKLT